VDEGKEKDACVFSLVSNLFNSIKRFLNLCRAYVFGRLLLLRVCVLVKTFERDTFRKLSISNVSQKVYFLEWV